MDLQLRAYVGRALKAILKWWPDAESNCGHKDFQSSALPTELPSHIALNLIILRLRDILKFFIIYVLYYSQINKQ